MSVFSTNRLTIFLGQAMDLIGEEAESVADITYAKPGGWYLTGPDSFHQLHCLVSSRPRSVFRKYCADLVKGCPSQSSSPRLLHSP